MTPLFAGFEGAMLPWNGHGTLLHARHTPDADIAGHGRVSRYWMETFALWFMV